MRKKRYDSQHRLLNTGEGQRKGRYEYRWTDKFGRRHSVYARTLEELRIKEQKLELNRLEGIMEPPAGLTIERLFDVWKNLKRGIKETTLIGYIFTFDRYIRPYIGKKLVVNFKRSQVRHFYLMLLDEKHLSISTVDNVHTVLHQVFQYAVDDDYLRKNPCDRVLKELKLSYKKNNTKEALSLKHEITFLKYLYDYSRYNHWFAKFYIMANTGLRVGEFTGLRWCDVDLDNCFIDVNHNLVYYSSLYDDKKSHYVMNTPKTEAGNRRVVFTPDVKQAFLMEKEYQELIGLKSIDSIDGYEDFVFVNFNGHVFNGSMLNEAIHRIVKEYNSMCTDDDDKLPDFSCHILRHTYATRLHESGASIKFIQSQLGHTDIQTTMNTYVSVPDDYKRRELTVFEEYMTDVMTNGLFLPGETS